MGLLQRSATGKHACVQAEGQPGHARGASGARTHAAMHNVTVSTARLNACSDASVPAWCGRLGFLLRTGDPERRPFFRGSINVIYGVDIYTSVDSSAGKNTGLLNKVFLRVTEKSVRESTLPLCACSKFAQGAPPLCFCLSPARFSAIRSNR